MTMIFCSFPGNETSPESFLLHNALARKPKRIRTAFSPSQLLRLEHAFEKNHYVVGAERKQLAHSLSLTETQVRSTILPSLLNSTCRLFLSPGQRAHFIWKFVPPASRCVPCSGCESRPAFTLCFFFSVTIKRYFSHYGAVISHMWYFCFYLYFLRASWSLLKSGRYEMNVCYCMSI